MNDTSAHATARVSLYFTSIPDLTQGLRQEEGKRKEKGPRIRSGPLLSMVNGAGLEPAATGLKGRFRAGSHEHMEARWQIVHTVGACGIRDHSDRPVVQNVTAACLRHFPRNEAHAGGRPSAV